ncbi:carbonic anhydrase 3-like [Patiria miniata]|uniref:Carbonic anhydrase n=1 Tax=Patiria miniata TaxID=46514 RepID=A0A913ZJ91_PATMI|nr:carbonic anhydrase 3-like [Patiria miniata]XP_038051127.1 carbonic anhydrase 3-like [Patiria miniata]XP_038051128.1 carbonic anhydrase 3-like [Patiria miniata]
MTALRALAIILMVPLIYAAEFTYDNGPHGPSHWASLFPKECAGSLQSPINLKMSQATDKDLGKLELDTFFTSCKWPTGTVVNNGHAVQIAFNQEFVIGGGGLPGKQYKVAQLHYHFGSKNGQGSEHALNGRHYEAEMHLVTYDTKYPSFDEAVKNKDGLAVFAGMIEVGFFENHLYKDFLSAVKTVKYKGYSRKFSLPCCLVDLLPNDFGDFYRYRGSLTTPHCNEVVIWTVWRKPVRLSSAQIGVFRSLYSSEDHAVTKVPLADNYRPLQAVNGRKILYNGVHNYRWVLNLENVLFPPKTKSPYFV